VRRKRRTSSAIVAMLGMATALLACFFAHAETPRFVGTQALAGVSVVGDAGVVLAQSTVATQGGQSRNVGDAKAPVSGSDKIGNRLTWFFAIGMVINVVVLGAFLVWAFKQWKRT